MKPFHDTKIQIHSESLESASVRTTRTLVIGSGVAGLRAAIEASGSGGVVMLGKAPPTSSNTSMAQGGIAVALHGRASCGSHVVDTLRAGVGLCDQPVVREMVEEGCERVGELIEWGMQFDRETDGSLSLGLEGAHSLARVVRSDGDATGRELIRCLVDRARACRDVTFADGWFAVDLITETDCAGARVLGVIAHHREHGMRTILARATILATGGAADLYRHSSNPGETTGDGIAMAYRAGADVSDMAFVQFHPTALNVEGGGHHLITEAVRGEGAFLVDDSGERFMVSEHPMGELAPRDVVSRAIAALEEGAGERRVYLDVRHVAGFCERFPGMTALFGQYGLDPAEDLIPVAPVAHFTIGGVTTDAKGRTSLPGLYAAGEVACSGLHGANRLASNSVLEGLVMGVAAAREAVKDEGSERAAPDNVAAVASGLAEGFARGTDAVAQRRISDLRSLMWSKVGIRRCGEELREAASTIDSWLAELERDGAEHPLGWKVRNMLLVAGLIARSALWRVESRGGHWRSDAPAPSAAFECHDVWSRGRAQPARRPVARDQTMSATP